MSENMVNMADVPMRAAEEELMEIQATDNLPASRQGVLALALNKGADPSVLSKLMDLQERWEANEAKKAYTVAMAAFKVECPPVVVKDSSVDFKTSKGRTHYSFVSLGNLVQKVTALLGKFGLSSSWETDQNDKGITVACRITHAMGHSETVRLTAPADDSGNKNCIQQIGSTVSYLERYTLFAALGLASGDQDDDGISSGPRPGADVRDIPNGGKTKLKPKGRPEPEQTSEQEHEQEHEPEPPARRERKAFERLDGCISEKQVKRLFAIAKSDEDCHQPWPDDEIKKLVLANGYEHTNQIPCGEVYDTIIGQLEA